MGYFDCMDYFHYMGYFDYMDYFDCMGCYSVSDSENYSGNYYIWDLFHCDHLYLKNIFHFLFILFKLLWSQLIPVQGS